jgi:hypothetical protein
LVVVNRHNTRAAKRCHPAKVARVGPYIKHTPRFCVSKRLANKAFLAENMSVVLLLSEEVIGPPGSVRAARREGTTFAEAANIIKTNDAVMNVRISHLSRIRPQPGKVLTPGNTHGE